MKSFFSFYNFVYASGLDRGRKRESNQDRLILCPEYGFFGVSDGMGGLSHGGRTAEILEEAVPEFIKNYEQYLTENNLSFLVDFFSNYTKEKVAETSDKLYANFNAQGKTAYGATFCGLWLLGKFAFFHNIGDSRGYLLRKGGKKLRQITEDHNLAAILVRGGELTREEARNDPASSRLTRFVGMEAPAAIDEFREEIFPGDRILLCSDGLHGVLDDEAMCRLLRSSRSPNIVCRRLIAAANEAGGRDNISAVYIKIGEESIER
jgi:serine/threonine protein phosphatase PrpC